MAGKSLPFNSPRRDAGLAQALLEAPLLLEAAKAPSFMRYSMFRFETRPVTTIQDFRVVSTDTTIRRAAFAQGTRRPIDLGDLEV